MNNKLIKLAIKVPYAYPWKREKLFLEQNQLDELLEKYNLRFESDRRAAGWKIKFVILKSAILSRDHQELMTTVINKLKNENYCSELIVKYYMDKLNLNNKENLNLYNKFFNNEIEITEIKDKQNLVIPWITEIFIYHSYSNSKIELKILQDKTNNYLNKLFENNDNYNELIKNQFYGNGLGKFELVKLFSKSVFDYKDEIEELFKNIIHRESIYSEIEDDNNQIKNSEIKKSEMESDEISDSILSLFNNSTILKLNEEEINQINEKKENVKVNIKKNNIFSGNDISKKENNDNQINNKEEKIFNAFKTLANTLEYKVASKEEIILSKNKYNKLINSNENKEINLVKELALLKNGAILSELYNAYKNINEISKDNLEAILTNFFFMLNVSGFEVMDDKEKVGDLIKVNTNKVLKEFVFTEETNKEGQVDVKVEYLGWKYKGKQIVPMAVKVLD